MSKEALETRAFKGLEVREAPADSGFIGVLEGYAAVFNSDSELMADRSSGYKPFIERIEPGAFTRSLTENTDVAAFWNHNPSDIIARTPNTLQLEEDERGLKVSISLADTSTNRDLHANVAAGNVDAMSFGFNVADGGDAWDTGTEPQTRTITDANLAEVSPVVWPAYTDTTIAVRSLDEFLQNQKETETREESESEPEEQETNIAPLRSIWAARLGVKTTKPQDNE